MHGHPMPIDHHNPWAWLIGACSHPCARLRHATPPAPVVGVAVVVVVLLLLEDEDPSGC